MDPAAAASIPILAGLSPKARKQVLKFARERTFAPGDVVVRQGDPALHLYIVASGTARVSATASPGRDASGPATSSANSGSSRITAERRRCWPRTS